MMTMMNRLLLGGTLAVALASRGAMAQDHGARGARGALGTRGSLGSLESLEALKSLESLKSMKSLEGLESLGAFQGFEAFAALGAGVARGFEGVAFPFVDDDDVSGHAPLSGEEQQADSLYKSAREALGSGDYRRAATLFGQVESKYPRSRYAADALYFRAFALYRSGDSGDLRSALTSLESLNSKYKSSRVEGDAQSLRVRICGELARRGDEGCARDIQERAAEPRAGTQSQQGRSCPSEDDEDDERVMALNALLQMDAERALPILEKVLARRDACSAGLRRKAVFLVSQKGGSRAADMLLSVAKTDPDREARAQAIFWLGQTRDDRVVDMLEDILKNSDDSELQDKAIFSLSQHRSDRSLQILKDAALNTRMSNKLREQAIFWLGQRHGADGVTFLRDLYPRLDEESLKDKVIFSISQQKGSESAQWLLTLAQNERESTDLRKSALFWAGQNRSTSMSDLSGLYDRMQNHEMKEQLIFVFSQRRDPGSVDKMLDIAKNEKDRELRKKAVFWLSQSKDPRIVKFLEDLLEK